MKTTLIGSFFFVSCSTLHQAKPLANQVPLTHENVSRLNGDYEIFSSEPNKESLDQAVIFKKYWWTDFESKNHYSMNLQAVDNNRLQATVYKNGSVVSTKRIRYKLQAGALLIKRKMIKPYVLINGYGTMHTRLRVITSGELVIDHSSSVVGGILIFPSAGKNVTEEGTIYKKKR